MSQGQREVNSKYVNVCRSKVSARWRPACVSAVIDSVVIYQGYRADSQLYVWCTRCCIHRVLDVNSGRTHGLCFIALPADRRLQTFGRKYAD